MAPAPIDFSITDVAEPCKDTLGLPLATRARLEKAGIDLSSGYPYRPSRPLYLDDVYRIRDQPREHVDPKKKALLSAAKEVIHLTRHIGTEIHSVIFFQDQDISPQQQMELGEYFGEVEVHASGYATYKKLSPGFCKFINGRTAIYHSTHPYLDRGNPSIGLKYIEREHLIMRVHLATRWKVLWVNQAITDQIIGLDRAESDLILGYLYNVYKRSVDIQVWFKWTPRTSALWDNQYDYEGSEPRHGTRVTALAEKPYFDPKAKTRREALGLLGSDEIEELESLSLTQ
ncbi:hypothetical protein BJX68DRAFT_255577 [Aspergillus pseudodeflectus]|uniref:TauD/TfdA-like domain-containing protein n=1 Tax=Aspergillus pseudodeflectus TaxID=176178 RepID=A0ABR4KB11_9EURO